MSRQPRRELRLNSFQMAAPSHNWAGLWKHPRDNQAQYHQLRYWADMARTAERGLLDGIFIADVFGIYDVYAGSADAALAAGAQSPQLDPTMLISAMALVTEHIGFGVTASLSNDHPFSFARRFGTLDHLTNGRLGWNIVTGYLESGARGLGHNSLRDHDERYDVAEDFMAAIYQLWEGSWEAGAAVRDKHSGVFTHPERVHAVAHDGPNYRVHGRALTEPSPQRTPLLYQAGSSARGQQFAGRHAEACFINGPTPAAAAKSVKALRASAQHAGRDPYDLLALLGATVIVAPTAAEAQDLRDEYRRYLDSAGQLALVSGWTGMDLSQFDLDDVLPFAKTNAIQSTVEHLTRNTPKPPKLRDLLDFSPVGARAPVFIGSPVDVADQMAHWVAESDIDGFNLVRTVMPESLDAIVDLLIPELQNRGMFKTRYEDGTLREKLFPAGGKLLPASHPGAAYRR